MLTLSQSDIAIAQSQKHAPSETYKLINNGSLLYTLEYWITVGVAAHTLLQSTRSLSRSVKQRIFQKRSALYRICERQQAWKREPSILKVGYSSLDIQAMEMLARTSFIASCARSGVVYGSSVFQEFRTREHKL